MSTSRLDMLVDAVDAGDHVVGSVVRRDVFAQHASFRVAHVFVFNHSGELLLQRIAPPLRSAGLWGSSVAAYLAAGESYQQAAERRYAEELGHAPPETLSVGRTVMTDSDCFKFIELVTAVDDGPFTLDASVITAVEFVPLDRIEQERAAGARHFTATFLHLLDFYLLAAPWMGNPPKRLSLEVNRGINFLLSVPPEERATLFDVASDEATEAFLQEFPALRPSRDGAGEKDE